MKRRLVALVTFVVFALPIALAMEVWWYIADSRIGMWIGDEWRTWWYVVFAEEN